MPVTKQPPKTLREQLLLGWREEKPWKISLSQRFSLQNSTNLRACNCLRSGYANNSTQQQRDSAPYPADSEPSPAAAEPGRRSASRIQPSPGSRAARPGPVFGITSNTLVRSNQSSSGPVGGASDGYGLTGSLSVTVPPAGTPDSGGGAQCPGPPGRIAGVRLPRPGHSESLLRTDPSVCPIMFRLAPVPIGTRDCPEPRSLAR